MAEALFKYKVEQQGLSDQIFVDSAGTGSWHIGHPPHEGTQAILKSKGISCADLKGRKLTPSDLTHFNYIIAMDQNNVKTILKYSDSRSEKRVQRLLDFVPEQPLRDVPDPYYTGDFEEVYALIDAGTDALLTHIFEEHQQLGVK
ncbi:low molecular weight protein-tyrosine-phosphatase YfkJ [Pullulanibacillus camelliae]|uniref:protein-tyrosine-phosphatase n=2 Tax=Pullulanibacillus camelliae TaxID=1707096 RepID=A0A8J2YIU2_9BACL|nr:low molecular weight protein-tyrosine-phosphatase YfkJ [Pullulanibacillus camelliae]